METNSSNLVCSNIVKKYKEKEVLHNINLTVEPNKIYGLIGRNGAGKTTLLSIMSAQNSATSGSITYDNHEVWENQKALDHICFSRELSQTAGNGPNNCKVKNYLKTAEIYYPNWDKAMANRLVAEFELDVKQKISKLSKGMLSMVTIIVALASKAQYTFLDEPVAGLDVIARNNFYKILLDEYAATGRTFVVSTHIIEEAADIFEEVIIIKNGTVLLKENTQELIEKAYHVSGKIEDVDNATIGLEVHHEDVTGRSKGVTVFLHEGQSIQKNPNTSVQSVNLQNLFVALCGREEIHS